MRVRNGGCQFWEEYQEKRANTQKEQRSDSVRKRESREEIEVYLGLPSIEPPTVENPKAHKTNRL